LTRLDHVAEQQLITGKLTTNSACSEYIPPKLASRLLRYTWKGVMAVLMLDRPVMRGKLTSDYS
jgi:hypothetical protein